MSPASYRAAPPRVGGNTTVASCGVQAKSAGAEQLLPQPPAEVWVGAGVPRGVVSAVPATLR